MSVRRRVLPQDNAVTPHIPLSVPNSGSFIRPSPAVSYGVSFLRALTAKYIDVPHGDTATEKIVLGSSNGAIEVEAVGLDKIRDKLARLERLREVSLDGECVSRADLPGEIERTCPGKCAQLLRDTTLRA